MLIVLLVASLFAAILLLSGWAAVEQTSAQTGTPTGGDWTSFTLNYNDSRYQAGSTITSSNVASLKQAWFFPANYSVTSTPIVQNGHVYFGDWGGNVYSLNINTGSINWKTNVGFAISSTPALANGLVYVAGSPLIPSRVIALNQNTGSLVWNTTLSCLPVSHYCGIYSSPIVYNGMVYIGESDCHQALGSQCDEMGDTNVGQVFALNALTGSVVWSFATGDYSSNGGFGAGVWGSETVDPNLNMIYFATGNMYGSTSCTTVSCMGLAYSIVALDATTGTLKWHYGPIFTSYSTGGDSDFGSTPNLFLYEKGGVTYQAVGVGNKNAHYYILDRTNGNLLNDVNIGGYPQGIIGVAGFVYSPGTTVNPEIFIPSRNGNSAGVLVAYNTATSAFSWKYNTPGQIQGSVAVVPGAVLFGDSAGNLYALSTATGSVLFQTALTPGYRLEGGVTVAEGYVLVGEFNGESSGANSAGLFAFSTSSSTVTTSSPTSTSSTTQGPTSETNTATSSSSSSSFSSSTTTVPKAPPVNGGTPLPFSTILIIASVIVAVAIISAAIFARRRV
jgi:outer membrane protein assembly factor BamB